jgi:hypothetical protein
MKDTGGPAFPTTTANYDDYAGEVGMTLRDYFAAMAMQGYLGWPKAPTHSEKLIAGWAYAQADAMLAERSKA